MFFVYSNSRYFSHLGEGDRVELVLGGNLKTKVLAALEVVGALDTGLDVAVDLLVVAGSNNAEVLESENAGVEGGVLVTGTSAVAGDGSLGDVVAGLSTDNETLVADGGVNESVDVAAGTVVEEGTGVEVGLLEGQVELLGGLAGVVGAEKVLELGLDGLRHEAGNLNLGVEDGLSGPALGDGDAWGYAVSKIYVMVELLQTFAQQRRDGGCGCLGPWLNRRAHKHEIEWSAC